MQYRHTASHPNELSILGFGCMRFERKMGSLDEQKAFSLLNQAIEAGVNYLDTAYIYPGSEQMLGRFFAAYPSVRDRIYLATKLPHYLIRTKQDIDRFFSEQLRRLKTDHIDYYLMHMLPDTAVWERLVGLGMEEWIAEKKRTGQIRQIGFSYHGNSEMFCRLLDSYDWDFCQIQYNYMDEHSQAGRKGLQYAASKGLPVIIMEPLRGGRLINQLPQEAKNLFREAHESPASFGLRWLWDQPGVTVVLSGMNSEKMVAQNCRLAKKAVPGCFTQKEKELLPKVRRAINRNIKIGCTGCGYCMPCPQGVDIPGVFRCYNEVFTDNYFTGLREYFMCTTFRGKQAAASQCIACGRCKKHCPQSIDIPAQMKLVAKKMETPPYKMVSYVIRKTRQFSGKTSR